MEKAYPYFLVAPGAASPGGPLDPMDGRNAKRKPTALAACSARRRTMKTIVLVALAVGA